jgi:prepilin-type N-terminal cleavage/methylation domain-containing protein
MAVTAIVGPVQRDSDMHNSRRGFSLLELMMVVSLIGIVAAMAVPRMRTGTDRATLSAARDVVASYANTARRTALSRSSVTQLNLVGDSLLTVTMTIPGGTGTVASQVNLRRQFRSFARLDGATSAQLVFDKRGLMRGNGVSRKFIIENLQGVRDSVCVSGAGLVMRGTCR